VRLLLLLRMVEQLWVWWKLGEWTRLSCSAAASVVAGELGSRAGEAWGASQADGRSTVALSRQ